MNSVKSKENFIFLPEALPDQVEAETFQTKGCQYGKINSRLFLPLTVVGYISCSNVVIK